MEAVCRVSCVVCRVSLRQARRGPVVLARLLPASPASPGNKGFTTCLPVLPHTGSRGAMQHLPFM